MINLAKQLASLALTVGVASAAWHFVADRVSSRSDS